MDYNQLVTALTGLGIDIAKIDVERASLYLDHLQAANLYFTTTLNANPAANGGALGLVGYASVQPALTSPSLLNELAEILDFYVTPALEADLNDQYSAPVGNNKGHGVAPNNGNGSWTYRQYFDNMILDPVNATYVGNRTAFRARYPIIDHALQQLSNNFQTNIQKCCERVIADRGMLANLFRDMYPANNLTIDTLQTIRSTGSDFHKGGKQVLILEFNVLTNAGTEQLKIVYKPSDLEADCLLAGNTLAVNAAIPGGGFMANSLFEIYNQQLTAYTTANPGFTGEPLDTYRILPRNYNSQNAAGFPILIRDAYGYIQYLNYDLSTTLENFFGFYPHANSDYLIFKTMNKEDKVKPFYRKAGAFCALACAFSIIDIHIENFRVYNYLPCPIDLEISLIESVNDIGDTSLLGTQGGLNGVSVNNQDSEWRVGNRTTPGRATINRVYLTKHYQNRLYAIRGLNTKVRVPVNNFWLLEGFNDAMQVLNHAQNATAFNAWFVRLNNNVVVRYLIFATPDFKRVNTNIYLDQLMGNAPGNALLPTVQNRLMMTLTNQWDNYDNNLPVGSDPNFLAFTPLNSQHDYMNLDIPVFYHVIGSTSVVNSLGNQVTIPANITVLNNANVPAVTPIGPAIGAPRANFFLNTPTTNNVRVPQITALGGATGPGTSYENRRAALQATFLAALNIGAVPANHGVIIP